MSALLPLFFILAFIQGFIMRRLGMVRHWRGHNVRLEVVYAVWGIAVLLSTLQAKGLNSYYNQIALFIASLPGITWGFMPMKQEPHKRLEGIAAALDLLIKDFDKGIFLIYGRIVRILK